MLFDGRIEHKVLKKCIMSSHCLPIKIKENRNLKRSQKKINKTKFAHKGKLFNYGQSHKISPMTNFGFFFSFHHRCGRLNRLMLFESRL
jgi:hypothetical protein